MTLRLDGFYCVRCFQPLFRAHFMRFVDAFQLYARRTVEVSAVCVH